jgi:uncharacterized protein (DUF2267 family)
MAGADAQNGLHPIDKQLLDQTQPGPQRLEGHLHRLHAEALARRRQHAGPRRPLDRDHGHAAVEVDVIRSIDHDIATGVYPAMTKHGWDRDDGRRSSTK